MSDERKPSVPMIKKLMSANGYSEKIEEGLKKYVSSLITPLCQDMSEESIESMISKNMPQDVWIKEITKIYARYLSASDVCDILAFYKTEAGKKMMKHQDAILSEATVAMQTLLIEMLSKVAMDMLDTEGNKDIGDMLGFDPDSFNTED